MILENVLILFKEDIDETEAAIYLLCNGFKIEKYFEGTGIFVGSVEESQIEELCKIPFIGDIADEYDRSLIK